MDLRNKKVFITGGSSGIGKAFVKELIAQGVTEIAVMGRREKPLNALKEEFKSISFLIIQGDVSILSDIERAIATITLQWGALDILINNAGVVSAGLLSEIPDEDIVNQVNINLTGVLLLTKKALPLLKASKEGAILNVSSGLGYVAMPFYSVYAATKAAIRQFSDAMRRELYQDPIHVMTIYPTATDTDMMENAKVNSMESPDQVAKDSIQGLIYGNLNVIFGGEERLEDIKTNFNHPKQIDQKAKQRFEALRIRTEHHRAM